MRTRLICCALFLSIFQASVPAQDACIPLYVPTAEQDKTLDDLEHRIFNYFWTEVYPETGIAVDHTQNRIGKVAATGFELAAVIIGTKRGWISYDEGYGRTWLILNAFYDDPDDPKDAYVDGNFGLFWHFVNGKTGRLEPIDCVAICDSADFIGGVVLASEFYKGTPAGDLAKKIYDNVEWEKFVAYNKDGAPGLLSFGWVPLHVSKGDYFNIDGLLPFNMAGFSDNSLLIYALALGSDTHRIPQQTWESYVDTYTLDEYAGYEAVMSGSASLFSRQVPHAFIKFSRKRDRKIDYFLEITDKILADRAFNMKVNGYPPELWGLTDCFGKNSYVHGAPPGQSENDGTVGSTAFVGGLPFTPEVSLASIKYVRERFGDRAYGKYGFTSSVNLKNGYVSPLYVGIELGPMIMHIENYRSGLIWDLYSKSRVMKNFVERARMSGVVDDFELAPEAAQYAFWKVTGGDAKISDSSPQSGRRCYEVISAGGPVTLNAQLTENDLMDYNYNKYLSIWTRDMKPLECSISYGGKQKKLKPISGLEGFGWKHTYFSIPNDARKAMLCGISIKCDALGKDSAIDNISLEAAMDRRAPPKITGIKAQTSKIGGGIDLSWKAPRDKAGDGISKYIVKTAADKELSGAETQILLAVSRYPSEEKHTIFPAARVPAFITVAAIDTNGHIGPFSKPVNAEPNPGVLDRVAFKCGKDPLSSVELSNEKLHVSELEDAEKGKCLKVEYIKVNSWDFLAFPLDPDMVAAHRYITVTVKGKIDLLGKLWCRDDFQFDMERKESDGAEEWSELKYDTQKASQIVPGRDAVKKLLLFYEPGKPRGNGEFLIDKIEYSN